MTDKSSHLPDNSDKNTKENFTPINPADGKKQKKKLGNVYLLQIIPAQIYQIKVHLF